ncbi:MAG: helix-turn-helix transcriptional regulator [Treponema sp.]|nr:helix-turn-helix transcriptional regulator [Treponema sp.]
MLNERIKDLRIARGLNQVDLAKRLGVTKQSISSWENDNVQPLIEMLVRLARTFSVSTDYLLGENSRTFLEVTGLTTMQIIHVQQIINDIAGCKNLQYSYLSLQRTYCDISYGMTLSKQTYLAMNKAYNTIFDEWQNVQDMPPLLHQQLNTALVLLDGVLDELKKNATDDSVLSSGNATCKTPADDNAPKFLVFGGKKHDV